MAYELKPGQGKAFVNKNKVEDWHAPYSGEVILPDGATHFLEITPGKTSAGEWWFRVKVGKPKAAKPVEATAAAAPVMASDDSDIPF
jgi:hypothetical protein